MTSDGYTFTGLGELKIYTRVVRSAMSLSEPERRALLFILDRTIGWHRVSAAISEREFISGVFRRRGGRRLTVVGGTGLSPIQLADALASLVKLNAINVWRFGKKTDYKINEYWCHPEVQEFGMWDVGEDNFEYDPERESIYDATHQVRTD